MIVLTVGLGRLRWLGERFARFDLSSEYGRTVGQHDGASLARCSAQPDEFVRL